MPQPKPMAVSHYPHTRKSLVHNNNLYERTYLSLYIVDDYGCELCWRSSAKGRTSREPASHNGELTSHNGELTSHNGELTSHNGELTLHNGKLTLRNGKLALHNGELTLLNGNLALVKQKSTPSSLQKSQSIRFFCFLTQNGRDLLHTLRV